MKLRYLLGFALMALFVTACSDDDEQNVGLLGDMQIDRTYVAIPEQGGDVTITVNATGDWKFAEIFSLDVKTGEKDETGKDITVKKTSALPIKLNAAKDDVELAWLSADKLSGTAGETKITFHADSTIDGRETELQILINGNKQYLKVRQGSMGVTEATCADVINGPEGKTYRVTGAVSSIKESATYGNWYIKDETGEVYIYGTLDNNGLTKQGALVKYGIEVGDIVTIEGPKQIYKGTVELVDVTVINIEKSLIKVDSLSIADGTLPHAGGEITAFLTCKGNGVGVDIPADAKDWLMIASTTPSTVTFRVMPNTGGNRKATVTFTTTDGEKEYTSQTTISQEAFVLPKGETPDNPFTVAEAIAKCQELGATASENVFYAKGIISSIKEVSTSYGNATFNISDDGKDENTVTVFRSLYLNNEKFTAEDQIGVGDEVVIVGKLVNYTKDETVTPEFSGSVYIYSQKKHSAGPEPGTLEKPFTPAEACQEAAKLNGDEKEVSTQDYYIKGKISQIKYTFSAQYGTAQFHISEDGSVESEQFLVYGTYYLGNQPWVEGNTQIAVGDEVIVYGKLTNYGGTLETANKKSYIYSLNGKTE
jgi:hypothetical protein